MKWAAGAKVMDRTSIRALDPRFEISKTPLTINVSYEFSFKIKDSVLLWSDDYATPAAAKADITAIQTGKYSWTFEWVSVTIMFRKKRNELAGKAGNILAVVNDEEKL